MALRFKEVFAEDEKECVPIELVKDLSPLVLHQTVGEPGPASVAVDVI